MKKKKEFCQHCNQREATVIWTGGHGVLGFVHGWTQRWCERCVVEAQLEYAKKRAETIPELEEKLKFI